MLETWNNFHTCKPPLLYHSGNSVYSEQLLWVIDGKLYIGYYIEEQLQGDNEETYIWRCIELASYDRNDFIEKYHICESNKTYFEIGESDDSVCPAKDYEIYWNRLDLFEILLHVDVAKKKEEGNKHAIEIKSDSN